MIRFAPLVFLLACTPPEETEDEVPEIDIEGAVFKMVTGGLEVTGADDGAADLVRLFFIRTVLIETHSVTDTSVEGRIAFSTEDNELVQDTCMQTVELPSGAFDGDQIVFGPEDADFGNYQADDLYAETTLSSTGERLNDMSVSAFIDLRQAGNAGLGSADSLCDTLDGFGLVCEDCPDNEAYCLDLEITGLLAFREEGVEIEPVAQNCR